MSRIVLLHKLREFAAANSFREEKLDTIEYLAREADIADGKEDYVTQLSEFFTEEELENFKNLHGTTALVGYAGDLILGRGKKNAE